MSEADGGFARDARRLLARPAPDAWLGLVVRVLDARVHESPAAREHTPPHFVVAGWAPQPDGVYRRLPEFAAIAAPDSRRALREIFVHLPADARLALVDGDVVDPALAAEMVLICDTNLEPYQRDALAGFVSAQREGTRARIAAGYTASEPGYARLRERLFPSDAAPTTDAGG